MVDETITEDEIQELVAKFASKSVHLFLYTDSCFYPEKLFSAPPPNFAAISAYLAKDAPEPAAPPAPEVRYAQSYVTRETGHTQTYNKNNTRHATTRQEQHHNNTKHDTTRRTSQTTTRSSHM